MINATRRSAEATPADSTNVSPIRNDRLNSREVIPRPQKSVRIYHVGEPDTIVQAEVPQAKLTFSASANSCPVEAGRYHQPRNGGRFGGIRHAVCGLGPLGPLGPMRPFVRTEWRGRQGRHCAYLDGRSRPAPLFRRDKNSGGYTCDHAP